jgi:hypothetical protein
MTAELGLAAYDTAVTSVELLIFIIKTAQQVKRLKAECGEVQAIATLLKEVIEKNEAALKGQKTATKLVSILQSVSQIVVGCTQSNTHRVWEVMWKHRLPKLLKDMMTWVLLLTTETSVGECALFCSLHSNHSIRYQPARNCRSL